MNIQDIKTETSKVIGLFTAKGLKPYAMKEYDLKSSYVAEKSEIDLKSSEIIVNAWKETVKEDSTFDKSFGGALMAAIAKAIEPVVIVEKAVPAKNILDEIQPADIKIGEVKPTNGGLRFEDKVRALLLREGMQRGLQMSKGALESKVRRASYEKEAGRLKDDPNTIKKWVEGQIERLDNQVIILEILQERGYQVQSFMRGSDETKPTTANFVGNADYMALCRAVGDTEGDSEKIAISMVDLFGFKSIVATKVAAAPAPTKAEEPVLAASAAETYSANSVSRGVLVLPFNCTKIRKSSVGPY